MILESLPRQRGKFSENLFGDHCLLNWNFPICESKEGLRSNYVLRSQKRLAKLGSSGESTRLNNAIKHLGKLNGTRSNGHGQRLKTTRSSTKIWDFVSFSN